MALDEPYLCHAIGHKTVIPTVKLSDFDRYLRKRQPSIHGEVRQW